MNAKVESGWSRRQTLMLINLFRQHVALYKVSHEDYLIKYKKQEALEEIAGGLKNIKPNVTAADVKKKIKILQQQVLIEKKKMRAATRSGMAADEVYFSKLWCFKDLQFLLNPDDEVCGQSNLEFNTLNDSFSETACSPTSMKAKRSKKGEAATLQQAAHKSLELLPSLSQQRSAEKNSKVDTFVKMLCSELEELKLVETYENVTMEMLTMVRKAKADERKRLCLQVTHESAVNFDSSTSGQSSLYSDPGTSWQSSLYSSNSFLEETSAVETLDDITFVEEGEECIEHLADNTNYIAERVEMPKLQKKTDILQKALQSIFE